MRVVGKFSLKNGEKVLEEKYPNELEEIYEIISSIDAERYKTKISEEKGRKGQLLYNPKELNAAFEREFRKRNWEKVKIPVTYSAKYYVNEYRPKIKEGAYREMDFVKNKVGVEVQFGKYAFMVYNVAAKMTIFKKRGIIEVGVEIVPVKEMQMLMSTGVSYFEQVVWDLETRGEADIDIPVLILGIIPVKLYKNYTSLTDYLQHFLME